MELEFDKEIDALMRAKGVLIGDTPPKGHLDADEIAAFAENALPERTRALHMAHIADCDRCRKILSNLIAIDAEAEPEKAAVAVPASAPSGIEIPWYRKLFLFPDLAYVMGGLMLVIGGLIGISVYQSSLGVGDAAVSQITENEPARGPMAPAEPQYSNTASTANAVSNAAVAASNANVAPNAATAAPSGMANVSSNASAAPPPLLRENELASAEASPNPADVAVTGTRPAAKPAQPMAAPPVPSKDADLAKEDDSRARVMREENEKARSAELKAKRSENVLLDGADAKNAPRTQAGGVAKATPGPARDMQQTFPNRADNTFNLKSRRVGGKDFEFRNEAWYDTAYRGQATTNIRRGTDDYKKLDGGLRSIAEKLSGVVVVVWSGKAYRIQ